MIDVVVLLLRRSCHSTHSKHLDELQFGRVLSRCILEGMTAHRELDSKYPSLYDKLVAVYSKMGFEDRKELRAVMHARGFGTAMPGVLAAAAVLSDAAKLPVPTAHATSTGRSPVTSSLGRGSGAPPYSDKAYVRKRMGGRRGSAEARMRLVSTPGSDLVDGVLVHNDVFEVIDPELAM